jgi:hypothetical protein
MGFWARLREQAPHPDCKKRCEKCSAWWVPFTTQVTQSGWTLCCECHDHYDQRIKDLSLVNWEDRRIRFLGTKGEPFYDERHYRKIEDED